MKKLREQREAMTCNLEASTPNSVKAQDAGADEVERLLDGMQTPKAKKGMTAAFNASPTRLGRAAVKAARKRGART